MERIVITHARLVSLGTDAFFDRENTSSPRALRLFGYKKEDIRYSIGADRSYHVPLRSGSGELLLLTIDRFEVRPVGDCLRLVGDWLVRERD